MRPEFPFPEPEDGSIGGEHQTKSRYDLRSSKLQDEPDAMDCDEVGLKPKTPYDYFATVYMDRNSRCEDNSRVATDPNLDDYNSTGVVFRGRVCHPIMDDLSSDSGSRV